MAQTPTHTSALAAAAVAPVTPMAAGRNCCGACAHRARGTASRHHGSAADRPDCGTPPPPIAAATPTSTPAVSARLRRRPQGPSPYCSRSSIAHPRNTDLRAPGGSANTLGQASVVRHQSLGAGRKRRSGTDRTRGRGNRDRLDYRCCGRSSDCTETPQPPTGIRSSTGTRAGLGGRRPR